MSIEAMKLALDALDSDNPDIQLRAAIALRQAIEAAEKQEPDELTIAYMSGFFDGKKKREWIGLTEYEIKSEIKYFCHSWYSEKPETLRLLVRVIEAKLREKNK